MTEVSFSDWAVFYERLFGKPKGSFRGDYQGTPIFEIQEKDAVHQKISV